jgi:hydrogenase maturation factor HypF (carbamoyltransferase family)
MHMNTARALGILLIGLVVGAAAGGVGTVALLRSDVGAGLIAQYISTQPQWPDVGGGVDIKQAQAAAQDVIAGTATLPVPKAYGTQQYGVALNTSLRQVAIIASSSAQLSTLLIAINNKSLAHDYTGIFDLVVEAKSDIAQQKDQVATLGQDLAVLSQINQSTPDATTKSATQDLIAKGNQLQVSLTTYNATLAKLLNGAVPTTQQIDDLKAQATALQGYATEFTAAAQTLEQHFSAAASAQ